MSEPIYGPSVMETLAKEQAKAYERGVQHERERCKAVCEAVRQRLMREQNREQDHDEAADLVSRAFGALLCERAIEGTEAPTEAAELADADAEHDAVIRSFHADMESVVGQLRDAINERDAAQNETAQARREAVEIENDCRAALARAVELLRAMTTRTDSASRFADTIAAVEGFLAEHGAGQ